MNESATLAPSPIRHPVERRAWRRRAFWLGVIVVAMVATLTAYEAASAGRESTDDAQVAADLVPVAPQIAGRVARVAVSENQRVEKGAVLVQLDDAEQRIRVEEAEADLATATAEAGAADAEVLIVNAKARGGLRSARAALAASTVGVGSAASEIEAARASALRAEAYAHKADLELARARKLQGAGASSAAELDDAQAEHDTAHASLSTAKATLAVALDRQRLAWTRVTEARGHFDQSSAIDALEAAARAQAQLAHARVRAAEARLALARLMLSRTRVVAPADGIASKLTALEGMLLEAGQPVIELVPIKSYVVANFKETQVARMKPGQKARITIDAFPWRSFVGTVESMAGGTGASFAMLPPDNASGNFVKVVQRVPVRVAWQPPAELGVRAGLSAEVTVAVGR